MSQSRLVSPNRPIKFGRFGCPSPDELAQAEKLLAGNTKAEKDKKNRAKVESLRGWAQRNLSADEFSAIQASRGEQRQQYLKEFLVMRLKEKGDIVGNEINEEENTSANADTVKMHEWNSTKMDEEMGGPIRGAAIRALPADDENACTWKPCPFTKRTDDPYRIWIVPVHAVEKTTLQANRHKIMATGDANVDDVGLLSTSTSASAGASGVIADTTIEVKTEEKTPEEIQAEKKNAILSDVVPHIRKLQEFMLADEDWKAKSSDPMRAPLVTEVNKTLPLINRSLAILLKIHKGEFKAEDEALAHIVMLLDQVEEKHKHCSSWAVTYGVCDKIAKKRSPKKDAD